MCVRAGQYVHILLIEILGFELKRAVNTFVKPSQNINLRCWQLLKTLFFAEKKTNQIIFGAILFFSCFTSGFFFYFFFYFCQTSIPDFVQPVIEWHVKWLHMLKHTLDLVSIGTVLFKTALLAHLKHVISGDQKGTCKPQ